MQSCFTPIASTSAAAPEPVCGIRFHFCSQFASSSSCCSPIAHASAAARRLRPLQLLLPIASASAATPRLRPLQFLLPDCVRFNCCSPIASASTAARPIASASTAAPRLRPLQLLLARFDCCSPIAYIRRLLDSTPCPGPMFSNILRGVRGSVNKLKYEGRASL